MRTYIFGDLHGRRDWARELDGKDMNQIIFLGDYFDSFNVPLEDQIANFEKVIQLKKMFPSSVVMLIGNHDFHYLPQADGDRYSGFQFGGAGVIGEMVSRALNEGLMQAAYSFEENGRKYLLTHAGVTQEWLKIHNIDGENLAEEINEAFKKRPSIFKFAQNATDRTGDNIFQSPIWVRPDSLKKNGVNGYSQIIGHTRMPTITIEQNGEFIFADAFQEHGEYLIIENGYPKIHKVI